MKRFPIDPEYLSGTNPITCRERLLLYLLLAEGKPVAPLYSGSYLTFSEIVKRVCEEGQGTEHFSGFGDLFEEAVNEELISVTHHDGVLPSEIGCEGYLIVGMKEDFVKDRFPSVRMKNGYAVLVMKNEEGNYDFVFGKAASFGSMTPDELDFYSDGTAEEITVGKGYRRLKFEYVDRFYEALQYDNPRYGNWKYSSEELRYVMALLILSRRRIIALLDYVGYDVKKMGFTLRSLLDLYHELDRTADDDIPALSKIRTLAMEEDYTLTGLIVREVDK